MLQINIEITGKISDKAKAKLNYYLKSRETKIKKVIQDFNSGKLK